MIICFEIGGCNGYQYSFILERSPGSDDDQILQSEDTQLTKNKIFIDNISMGFLHGIELDFTQELIGESFKIISNPNASSECTVVTLDLPIYYMC